MLMLFSGMELLINSRRFFFSSKSQVIVTLENFFILIQVFLFLAINFPSTVVVAVATWDENDVAEMYIEPNSGFCS